MTAFDFPGDLLAAQRKFFAQERQCEAISAALPSNADILAGKAAITPEQHARLAAARGELQQLARTIIGHDWWKTTDRSAARAALREAARQ